MKTRFLFIAMIFGLAGLIMFYSCSSDDEDPPPQPPPAETYTVGGNVSGASGSLILVLGNEELTVTGDGSFSFANELEDGAQYNVTVRSAPDGQYAEVTNGSGTINGANVNDITVTCIDIPEGTYTVGGTVEGLTGTLVITNNGADELTITENGPFTFGIPLADGSSYNVTIVTQPDGELCSITNGSGTIEGTNVSDVAITCEPVPEVSGKYYAVDLDNGRLSQFQADKSLLEISGVGLNDFDFVSGLAYDSDNDILYGFSNSDGTLLTIDRSTGVGTAIGNVGTSEIIDIAYDKNADKLYGVNYSFGQLLEINVTTGAFTVLYSDPGLEDVFGLAYDPNNDILYGTTVGEELIEISITAAAPSVIGSTQFGVFRGLGYDTDNDILYGVLEQNQGDAVLGLWEINTSTGFPTFVGTTGLLNQGFGAGLTYADGDDQLLASSGTLNPAKLYEVDRTDATTVSIGSSGYNIYNDLAVRDTDQLIYTLEVAEDILLTFNTTDGTTTFKRELRLNGADDLIPGFTYKAADDGFYALTLGSPLGIYLTWIDAASDSPPVLKSEPIVNGPTGIRALAYDNDNSKLYAATLTGIAEIDESSGTIVEGTEVTLNSSNIILAMNFDPNNNVLVATTADNQVIAINPATGDIQVITSLPAGVELVGITYKDN